MEACLAGNMDGLMSLLAEDVTVWADGGGKVSGAARHPIQGRDKVARAIIGLLSRTPEGTSFEVTEANGLPALLIRIKGQIVGVLTLEVTGVSSVPCATLPTLTSWRISMCHPHQVRRGASAPNKHSRCRGTGVVARAVVSRRLEKAITCVA